MLVAPLIVLELGDDILSVVVTELISASSLDHVYVAPETKFETDNVMSAASQTL